jgi:hypothetical protein
MMLIFRFDEGGAFDLKKRPMGAIDGLPVSMRGLPGD